VQGQTQLSLPVLSADIDLSVIIVSYNTKNITLECVQSVLDHKGALAVEIIVVDNCSTDGSTKALRDAFPDITVIDSPANGGFAYGNNIGFEKSHGRYILLLNPDTRVHPGGLEKAVAYMDTHQKTGCLGPRVLNSDGQLDKSMMRYLSLTQFFFLIFIPAKFAQNLKIFGDMRYASRSYDDINDIDAMTGCFILTRRKILEEIGGLDQRFFMYGEETEWCRRITRAGWKIQYHPDITILHHGAASTVNMSEWKAVEMTKGHILFLKFTRGAFVAWIGTLFMIMRDILRAPYYGVISLVKGFRWSANAKPWWKRLKFLIRAIIIQPQGQTITRPAPVDIITNTRK